MPLINWGLLADAVQFYRDAGCTYVDVPWVVHEVASDVTRPPDKENFYVDGSSGVLSASAEQGFFQMAFRVQLEPDTDYVSCSPCFRRDSADDTHVGEFLKVELFRYRWGAPTVPWDYFSPLAYRFFSRYLQGSDGAERGLLAERERLLDGEGTQLLRREVSPTVSFFGVREHRTCDINANLGHREVELGSYGVRDLLSEGRTLTWHYGTGCAEPRLSRVLQLLHPNGGYHCAPIPRGQLGESSKVQEETLEFLDAVRQRNPVMALVELSDLYGAVEQYLHRHCPGVSMSDLATMSDATKRAFQGGQRG